MFVSLSESENMDMMARVPTPPPRNYYPIADYETLNSWFNPRSTTQKPINPTTQSYAKQFTNKAYIFQSEIIRRIQDQQSQLEDFDTVTPPSYLEQDNLWEGYSKVLADLLKHRRHPQPNIKTKTLQDTNEYIGDPVVVSTNTIIVGPGISQQRDDPIEISSEHPLIMQSEQYDWTYDENPSKPPQYRIYDTPSMNWTSIELAKPVWDEDTGRVRKGGWSLEQGNTNKVNSLHEKDTYGHWDRALDILPSISR